MNNDVVALVGGAGFVGTRLASRLQSSSVPYIVGDIDVSGGSPKVCYLDVEDFNSFDKLKGVSTIVNLAALHRDDVKPVSRYDDVNVNGALNLCNAARELGISKMVFTSSVAIYGFAPAGTDESGEIGYFNDYGRTKYLAEEVY